MLRDEFKSVMQRIAETKAAQKTKANDQPRLKPEYSRSAPGLAPPGMAGAVQSDQGLRAAENNRRIEQALKAKPSPKPDQEIMKTLRHDHSRKR
jgi:hypothetical protein